MPHPCKLPAQPGRSARRNFQHTCQPLQALSLTKQQSMACPGLAIHKMAELCVLWLPNGTSSLGNLLHSAKPHPPQSTFPAQLQPQVQAPPHLLHTAEAAFDLALTHGIPKAGHSHAGGTLCTVVAKCHLLLWKSPQTRKIATHKKYLPSPAAAPSASPTTPAKHSRGCI